VKKKRKKKKLLMMDRGTVQNMLRFIPKYNKIEKLVHPVGFIIQNLL
jgi:hypothetical protein